VVGGAPIAKKVKAIIAEAITMQFVDCRQLVNYLAAGLSSCRKPCLNLQWGQQQQQVAAKQQSSKQEQGRQIADNSLLSISILLLSVLRAPAFPVVHRSTKFLLTLLSFLSSHLTGSTA
jgi:hypothetical protein